VDIGSDLCCKRYFSQRIRHKILLILLLLLLLFSSVYHIMAIEVGKWDPARKSCSFCYIMRSSLLIKFVYWHLSLFFYSCTYKSNCFDP